MIGFPGFGLQFEMNKILVNIGNSFAIHWYGLIIAVGFLLAVIYGLKTSKKYSITQDEVIDMLLVAAPAGIICARLYYVAFNWSQYKDDLGAIIRMWDGGMAIYGGIIGSAAACLIFCKVRRISAGAMLDIGAVGLLIGQGIGRWGNFVNVEVYGRETDLPWRMWIEGMAEGSGVHPLFLYESLWCLAGAAVLALLAKKRKYNGQIFLAYVAWYGFGRGMLEGMRTPEFNLYIGDFMVSQLLAFISCLAALFLLLWNFVFDSRRKTDIMAWAAVRDAHVADVKARKARKKSVSLLDDEETGEYYDEDVEETEEEFTEDETEIADMPYISDDTNDTEDTGDTEAPAENIGDENKEDNTEEDA